MVSNNTLILVIASVGGTIATILTITTLWIWRHTTNLYDNDIEKIEELKEKEWDEAAEDLSEFFIDVANEIDQDLNDAQTLQNELIKVIDQDISENELNNLVSSLKNIGQGRDLHRSHRREYKNSYTYLAIASFITIIDAILGIVHVTGSIPLGDNGELSMVILGIGGIMAFLWGVKSWRKGRNLKEEFIQLWENNRLKE